MLGDTIREIRKARGMSQEALAERLHVVRQTISKWEKGLSVPDADLLQRLAEVFETDVGSLLGAKIVPEKDEGDIARLLAGINEELAVRNRRSRRIWKTAAAVLIAVAAVHILLLVFSLTAAHVYTFEPAYTETYSEEILIED